MKWQKKYIPVRRYACLAIMFQALAFSAFSQCPSATTIYQQVCKLETDTTFSPSGKFTRILTLKKQYEDCHLPNDSVYARILHRTAAFEYAANNNTITPSIISNTLQAARINTSNTKNASQKFGVKSFHNLAFYYDQMRDYDKEILYADSVIFFNKSYPDQQTFTFEALSSKAFIYGVRRDYEKCAEISTMGIAAAEKARDSSSLIDFYYYRAQGYCNQKIWQFAAADVDSGLHYATLIGNNQKLADFAILKARCYAGQKDYTNANINFQKGLGIRTKSGDKSDLISDYLSFGNYFLEELHDAQKSIPYYKKMMAICTLPQDNIYLAQAYTATAEAHFRLGDLAEARRNDSIASFCLAPSSPRNFLLNATANQLSIIDNKDVLLVFMNNKIELLLCLYKQTHQPTYLEACLRAALVMDTLVTKTRHEQLGEQTKLYWRNKTRDFFNNAIEACYILGNDKQAFYFMEKSRAVLLGDKLSELSSMAAHLPAEAATNEAALQAKVIQQQQVLSALPAFSKAYKDAENNLLQTKDSLEQFIQSLEKKYPAYYQYKYDDNVPALSDVQSYISNNNQSFVDYFTNDTAIYAIGISKNKTNFIKIKTADFDGRQLSQFIRLCSNKQALMNDYPSFASLSQNIYKKIFEPLEIATGNVAICTDNFFIPFEALCTDEKGKNFLLYNYNFSYVYSARSLLKPFACSAPRGNFAGFAPVSFSPSLHVFELKQSAAALKKVAGFYSSNTLFTNEKATRNNFFSNASHYSVVTIFSHAKADTTDAEPVLYMSDSLIHLSELQRLNNPSIQFVLLSACQTNIGKNATGEGIYSLARGFASAGIPAVSATLWKADEDAVYQITTKFNEYLAAGMNKSEALQKAKIWYLQNSSLEHTLPYYWANMVLIGTSQPVSLAATHYSWIWMAIIAFLILFLLYHSVFIKRSIFKKNSNFL